VLVVFLIGRASGSPARATAAPAQTAGPCPAVADHTAEGAATTAAAGLAALAVIDLAPASTPDLPVTIEQTLARYVVPEQRAAVRAYLAADTPALDGAATVPVAYAVSSYSDDVAAVRLLAVDYARHDGKNVTAAGVITATLRWDATQELWRLVTWPADPDPEAVAKVAGSGRLYCHVAS
jgi:hypothetical protein